MPETQQKNYRFSQRTLDLIDRLAESFGGIPRSDVLRIAVEELAARRLLAGKKIPKKSQTGS